MSRRSVSAFRIGAVIIGIAACILFAALNLAAQEEQSFKGKIVFGTCTDQTGKTKNEAPPRCIGDCGKTDMKFMLLDSENKVVYQLDNQKQAKANAGKYVVVFGNLNNILCTVQVSYMIRTIPKRILNAKTAYIDCEACPRAMAAAGRTAHIEMAAWGRFDLVDDPDKADLIFLFAANPYLGDYLTRDGPDKRPVTIQTTYMDIIDPDTGESLWGGSKQAGALFVTRETKGLITEFRAQVEAAELDPAQQLELAKHKKH